jgi:hypothetical protein
MTEKEILEGNKIIAEFMGEKVVGSNKEWVDIEFQGKPLTAHYQESWDWLLPVYKKLGTDLKKLSSDIKSYKGCSWVSKQATLKHIDDCDAVIRCEIWGVRIMDTFNGIVETIKWYNKNKDNKQWLKNSNEDSARKKTFISKL